MTGILMRLVESTTDFMTCGSGTCVGLRTPFPAFVRRGGHSDSFEDERSLPVNVIAEDVDAVRDGDEDSDLVKRDGTDSENSLDLQNVDKTASTPPIIPPKPSGIDQDPDGIPLRFLEMQKHNRALAAEAYENTLRWREENGIDDILNKPKSRFDIFKAVAPHYFPGFDIDGNIIFVQRPGLINMELKKVNNVNDEDLVNHMVFVLEYCWAILAPPKLQDDSSFKDCVMTSVIDMTGLNLGVIRHRDRIEFASRFVKIMSSHYPSRSYKTLIINAPVWFGTLFKLFKPMLRESTRKKIAIYSGGKSQDKALTKLLGESTPAELMSDVTSILGDEHTIGKPGPHSTLEINLRSFCMERLRAEGLDMEPVLVVTS